MKQIICCWFGWVAALFALCPMVESAEKTQVIFLLHDGIEVETVTGYARQYRTLETNAVDVLLRIQNVGKPLRQTIRFCEEQRYPYLLTAASSDFVAMPLSQDSMYRNVDDTLRQVRQPLCRGVYLHELFAQHATDLETWDPQEVAAAGLDWDWLERLVRGCVAAQKPIYWSDGGLSWEMFGTSPRAEAFGRRWGAWIIPLFATNFVGSFRENAQAAEGFAQQYETRLGVSVQDWHFIAAQDAGKALREKQIDYADLGITPASTLRLLDVGNTHGCRVFEIEGTQTGMHPESAFMQGVAQFMAAVGKVER